MASWFSRANRSNVGGQPDTTPVPEVEARLKELERHRPEYELAGATHLADPERRLRETAEWCTRHLDLHAIGTCLRPRSIAPNFLGRDRWRSVSDVTGMRRQELNHIDSRASEMPQGRFLVYYPDAELSDGAAEVASQEFFDVYNAPPWGTWVGYFEDPGPDESGYGSYVVSWVPEELVNAANSGIEVNPEQCIAWLEQANVGVRAIIEMIAVKCLRTPVCEIDGARFRTLEEFFDEISKSLIPGADWGRNLDAFNDILRGGFGTPDDGFTIRWRNHALSRERLGHAETARQLELRLQRCHPSNRSMVRQELAEARAGLGPTVFDWLIDIIRSHGPGGTEAEDDVHLVLD